MYYSSCIIHSPLHWYYNIPIGCNIYYILPAGWKETQRSYLCFFLNRLLEQCHKCSAVPLTSCRVSPTSVLCQECIRHPSHSAPGHTQTFRHFVLGCDREGKERGRLRRSCLPRVWPEYQRMKEDGFSRANAKRGFRKEKQQIQKKREEPENKRFAYCKYQDCRWTKKIEASKYSYVCCSVEMNDHRGVWPQARDTNPSPIWSKVDTPRTPSAKGETKHWLRGGSWGGGGVDLGGAEQYRVG